MSFSARSPRSARRRIRFADAPGLTRLEVLAMISVGLLLVIAGGWFFRNFASMVAGGFSPGSPPPLPLSMGSPMQTIACPDGGSLLIDGIAEARLDFGTLKIPTGFNGSSGFQTRGLGSTQNKLESTMVKAEGKVVGVAYSSTPGALLVACRFLAPDGTPLKVDRYPWGDWLQSGSGQELYTPAWETMLKPGVNPADLPEFLVQISDGAGGWIFANGPCYFDDSPDGLSVLAFPVWPRSQAELTFRAVRPGQSPFKWKLPNPVHPASPAPWPIDPLPRVINAPEFDLVFSGTLAPAKAPGAVIPDFEFHSKIPGEENLSPNSRSLEARCDEVQGALGTRSMETRIDLGNSYGFRAFPLPPDESLLRFVLSVCATGYYRYPRTDMVPLLTATVSADGKSLSLDSSRLTAHGLDTGTAEIKDDSFLINLEFKWPTEADRLAAERALLLDAEKPVCFVGDSPTSLGEARVTGSSSSSSGNGPCTLGLTIRWMGIPRVEKTESPDGTTTRYFDALPGPGETILFGMVRPKPAQTFHFVIPRPAQEKKVD